MSGYILEMFIAWPPPIERPAMALKALSLRHTVMLLDIVDDIGEGLLHRTGCLSGAVEIRLLQDRPVPDRGQHR